MSSSERSKKKRGSEGQGLALSASFWLEFCHVWPLVISITSHHIPFIDFWAANFQPTKPSCYNIFGVSFSPTPTPAEFVPTKPNCKHAAANFQLPNLTTAPQCSGSLFFWQLFKAQPAFPSSQVGPVSDLPHLQSYSRIFCSCNKWA